MKTRLRAPRVIPLSFLLAFTACGTPPPTPGSWVGQNISFNVSPDGRRLTTTGSTLESSVSLLVKIPLQPNQFGMSRQTRYLRVDIPISGGSFTYSDEVLEVRGSFISPAEASGTFELADKIQQPGQFGMTTEVVQGRGAWTATPAQAPGTDGA